MFDVSPIWAQRLQQQNYRALLNAMSRPGSLATIECGEENASVAVLATLLDGEVSLADPDRLLAEHNWPLLQVRRAGQGDADYMLCRGDQPPVQEPKLGTLASPEQSTTLIVYVASLHGGELSLGLSGPGVNGRIEVAVSGLHPGWLSQRADWVCAFPLGVDMILVDDSAVMCLPRTTAVEIR